MNLQIAWRNIWRNPRRTAIILTAIIIGVWSMIFLGAIMRGTQVEMFQNSISTLTGNIQIHHKGYRDDPVVENSMTDPGRALAAVKKNAPPGSKWTTRVRVGAVAANARHSSGVTLVGIDPAREAEASFIGRAMTEGEYLKPDDKNGIIVGQALLDKFETKLGRKLVLMSQDTEKQIASRAYRIRGVYRAELESTEKQFVFVTESSARNMLKMGDSLSEISILLPEQGEDVAVAEALKSELTGDYEVLTWKELLPLITAMQKMYDGFTIIWYVVVFIAMGFGIVNTTLMAVYERMREFGLLKALGMKPRLIIMEVMTESLFLLLLGLTAGNILGLASVWALHGTGLDLSSLAAGAEMAGFPRIIYPALIAKDIYMANAVVSGSAFWSAFIPRPRPVVLPPLKPWPKPDPGPSCGGRAHEYSGNHRSGKNI